MPVPCFWAIKDFQYAYRCNGYIITVTTDIPCHLYLRYTVSPPRIHVIPTYKRGIQIHGDPYFCFVAYTENEQEEAGDTLIHTFIKFNWPVCQTRYFYFVGSVSGTFCVSTSAVFKLHFNILSATLLPSHRNCIAYKSSVNWAACHDATHGQAVFCGNPPNYLQQAGDSLTASYWIYRAFFFFQTALLPDWSEIIDGWVSLFVHSVSIGDLTHPYIYLTEGVQGDPIDTEDYGNQLPYTTSFGEKDLTTIVPGGYNNIPLNSLGCAHIKKTVRTRFCLRGQRDIENIAYTVVYDNSIVYYNHQKGPGLYPLLHVCYPPKIIA